MQPASIRNILGARARHPAHDAQAQHDQAGDRNVSGRDVQGDQRPGQAADENHHTDQVSSVRHVS